MRRERIRSRRSRTDRGPCWCRQRKSAPRAVAARARALAVLGRVQDAVAAVGMADEAFSNIDNDEIPWMLYWDEAQHAGDTGYALCAMGSERSRRSRRRRARSAGRRGCGLRRHLRAVAGDQRHQAGLPGHGPPAIPARPPRSVPAHSPTPGRSTPAAQPTTCVNYTGSPQPTKAYRSRRAATPHPWPSDRSMITT